MRIEKNDIYQIVANGGQPVYVYYNGRLYTTVSTGETTVFGPFTAITEFMTTSEGSYVIEKVNQDFQTPELLADYVSGDAPVTSVNGETGDVTLTAAAVADAEDETDIVAQFNALLSSLRDAGLLAESEEPEEPEEP